MSLGCHPGCPQSCFCHELVLPTAGIKILLGMMPRPCLLTCLAWVEMDFEVIPKH